MSARIIPLSQMRTRRTLARRRLAAIPRAALIGTVMAAVLSVSWSGLDWLADGRPLTAPNCG